MPVCSGNKGESYLCGENKLKQGRFLSCQAQPGAGFLPSPGRGFLPGVHGTTAETLGICYGHINLLVFWAHLMNCKGGEGNLEMYDVQRMIRDCLNL